MVELTCLVSLEWLLSCLFSVLVGLELSKVPVIVTFPEACMPLHISRQNFINFKYNMMNVSTHMEEDTRTEPKDRVIFNLSVRQGQGGNRENSLTPLHARQKNTYQHIYLQFCPFWICKQIDKHNKSKITGDKKKKKEIWAGWVALVKMIGVHH